MARKLSEEKVQEICRRYQAGESSSEIAEDFDVAPSSILRRLRKCGVTTRLGDGPVRLRKLNEAQIQEAARRYQTGESMSELAQDFGVSDGTISRSLRRHGVAIRPCKFSEEQEQEICRRYEDGEATYEIACALGIERTSVIRCARRHGVTIRTERQHKLSITQENEAVERYLQGESCRQAGERFGVTAQPIIDLLERRGITRRSVYKLSRTQSDEMCQRYVDGESMDVLAVAYGVNKTAVHLHLKRRRIPRRSLSQAERRYQCNHSFFYEIDTEGKAYWLGFIAADGCVVERTKALSIGLQGRDREHLARLLRALDGDHKIYARRDRLGREYCVLYIASPEIAGDLCKHELRPRKTEILGWPSTSTVPSALLRHYLRGLMDGDGGFYPGLPNGKHGEHRNLVFAITSTRRCLEGAQEFLMDACQLGKTKLYRTTSTNPDICCLKYGGAKQVSRIFHLLYDDAHVWLPRKREGIEPYICQV